MRIAILEKWNPGEMRYMCRILATIAILRPRQENSSIKTLDPATYNDTAWYDGAILALGEIVK